MGSNWPYRDEETGKVIAIQAVVLGLGSLFNHSSLDQNVYWSRDLEAQCVVYRALRDVKAGEELCINYGRLWFFDADTEGVTLDTVDGDGLEVLGRIDLGS